MPIQRCKVGGKSGYRWGSGKCYVGKGARAKAARQARAIRASGYSGNRKKYAYDKNRPSAALRGYGRKWQRQRREYLETNPHCRICSREGKEIPATEVDHITPHKGIRKRFFDKRNWQALCKSCHSNKTRTDNALSVIRVGTSSHRKHRNPLRTDPTRTATLRRKFQTELSKRFNSVRRKVTELIVEEDALGLKPVSRNPFVGNVGGHCPICGEDVEVDFCEKCMTGDSRVRGPVNCYDIDGGSDRVGEIPTSPTSNKEQSNDGPGRYAELDRGIGGAGGEIRIEGSGDTAKLRQGNNVYVGISNTRWRFHTDSEKVRAFTDWLRANIATDIIRESEDVILRQFVEEGFRKGAGRAFDDTRRAQRANQSLDFYQGTKEEFLKSAFGQPVAIDKVRLLVGRTLTDLRGVSEQMATVMSRVLADGLVRGQGPRQVARNLTRALGILRNRALAIARSELIRAHAEGQLTAFEQLGVEELGVAAEWSTTGDDRVCFLCAPLEGVVLKVKEARNLLPRHPNCILAGTEIQASNLKTAMRAEYTGEVVRIRTCSGGDVAVTKNHILLTEFGFVRADFLYEGLNLLDASRVYPEIRGVKNENGSVTLIEDIFSTMSAFGIPFSTRPRSVDFHGDGEFFDFEVSIIRADSVLWDKIQLVNRKSIEQSFPLIDFFDINGSLLGLSPAATLLKRIAFTSDCSMGVCRDSLALLLGHILHAQLIGFGTVAAANTYSFKSSSDSPTATSEVLRNSVLCHPILKHFDKFIDWQTCTIIMSLVDDTYSNLFQSFFDSIVFNAESSSDFGNAQSSFVETNNFSSGKPSEVISNTFDNHTCLGQLISDSPPAGSVFFRQVSQIAPGLVALDEIVNVERFHVKHTPVYDIETEPTIIIAGGVTMCQCRCAWTPAGVGEKEADQKQSKGAIDKQFRRSLAGEIPKGSRRSVARQRDLSRWAGADKDIGKTRPQRLVRELLTRRAFRAAQKIAGPAIKLGNLGPEFAKEILLEANVPPIIAKIGMGLATVGDFAIPGLPVGSAVVAGLGTIKNPLAPIRVVKRAVRGIIGKIKKTARELRQGVIGIGV